LAYVIECFAQLGCDIKAARAGGFVPLIQLSKHQKLVRQFYRVLEDAHLILVSGDGSRKTSVPVDTTPAEAIYNKVIAAYPEHVNVHKLVKVVGSELAPCLTGEKDVIALIFGNKTTKALEDLYEFWPLNRILAIPLGDFLLKAFSNFTGCGKFRILDVGAGTGDTTRPILDIL
jgi:hypothetical protein